jgi:hypothetical protein
MSFRPNDGFGELLVSSKPTLASTTTDQHRSEELQMPCASRRLILLLVGHLPPPVDSLTVLAMEAAKERPSSPGLLIGER